MEVAEVLFRKGNFEEAAEAFEQNAKNEDNTEKRAVSYCNASTCLLRIGGTKKSLEMASSALCANPSSVKAILMAGIALVKLGENIAYHKTVEGYRLISLAVLLSPSLISNPVVRDARKIHIKTLKATCVIRRQHPGDALAQAALARTPDVVSGIGVVAVKPILAGANVSSFGEILMFSPAFDTHDSACFRCGKHLLKSESRSCPVCQVPIYCSEACALRRKRRHAYECRIFSSIGPSGCFEDGVIELVTGLSALATEGSSCLLWDLCHASGSETSEPVPLKQFSAALIYLVKTARMHDPSDTSMIKDNIEWLDLIWKRLSGVMDCNAFQLTNPSGLYIGAAVVNGIASRFNHSCAPNAELDGNARIIRAIKPIKERNEIFVSYIPELFLPYDHRQEKLSNYGFVCTCSRCSWGNMPLHEKYTPCNLVETLLEEANSSNFEDDVKILDIAVGNMCSRAFCGDDNEEGLEEIVQFTKRIDYLLRSDFEYFPPSKRLVLRSLHRWTQQLRSARVYLQCVLGRPREAYTQTLEEFLFWETLVTGSLSIKRDKLRLLGTQTQLPEEERIWFQSLSKLY